MTRSGTYAAALVLGALTVRASAALAQGCAMCGAISGEDPRARAFSLSILFLIAAPYTFVGLAAVVLFSIYRRRAARQRAPIIELRPELPEEV
jgi:hypothetical protein